MNSNPVIEFSISSFSVGLVPVLVLLTLTSEFVPLPRPYFYAILSGVALTTYRLKKYNFQSPTWQERTIVSAIGAVMCVVLEVMISAIFSDNPFVFPLLGRSAPMHVSILHWVGHTIMLFVLTRILFSKAAE